MLNENNQTCSNSNCNISNIITKNKSNNNNNLNITTNTTSHIIDNKSCLLDNTTNNIDNKKIFDVSLNNINNDQESKNSNTNKNNYIIDLSNINLENRTSKKENILYYALLNKNILFRNEFTKLPFKMTCPILYKEKKDYKLYPLLIIEKNNLTILKAKDKGKIKTKIKRQRTESVIEIDNSISNNIIANNGKFSGKENTFNNLYDVDNPILNLNFNLITANLLINIKKLKIAIEVLSIPNIKFKLKIPNDNMEIFKRLIIILDHAISTSKGHKTNLFGVSLRKNFDKNYYYTIKEFESVAKTGDLLIFRGKECPAKMQRFYTKSDYDHVALLFKRFNILYVYEATSKEGCKLRQWKEFVWFLWYLLYDKIVYRKLIIKEDTKEKIDSINLKLQNKAEDFLNQTQGKNYHIEICSILCTKNDNKNKNNDLNWQNYNGFLCSGLVEGALVNMGIMKYTINIDTVLPGDFSHEKNLPLNEPFQYDHEVIIDFTE